PALATHDQVEVAQAHVEINHRGLEPTQGKAGGQRCAGGGLAHATFAGCHDDDLGHALSPQVAVTGGAAVSFTAQRAFNGMNCMASPSREICTAWSRQLSGRSSATR